MSSALDTLNSLSVADYANDAFTDIGGIYRGTATGGNNPTPFDRKVFAPRARLTTAAPGRIFARWVGSWAFSAGWEAAASGFWWSTDYGADAIVDQTIARFGPHGDSGVVAREFSNVGYTDDAGNYRSDMKAVVVCRVTQPVRILVGVGRPVKNKTALSGGRVEDVLLDSRELQAVILTKLDQKFCGHEFFHKVALLSSTDFTQWWVSNDPFHTRRRAAIDAARARKAAAAR